MKILKTLFLALLLCLSLTGCALFKSPNAAFVGAVDAGLNDGPSNAAILSKYEKYVDADATLTPDTKKIEHATVSRLRKLIEDAKK